MCLPSFPSFRPPFHMVGFTAFAIFFFPFFSFSRSIFLAGKYGSGLICVRGWKEGKEEEEGKAVLPEKERGGRRRDGSFSLFFAK